MSVSIDAASAGEFTPQVYLYNCCFIRIIGLSSSLVLILLSYHSSVDECRMQTEKRNVEVGPLWSNKHANKVAARYLEANPTHSWNGSWW